MTSAVEAVDAQAAAICGMRPGVVYVMVLAAIAITGILLVVADVQTSHAIKRERDEELLYRGLAYRTAIRSQYESGTPVKSFPRELKDLLKDPRSVHKRHPGTLYPRSGEPGPDGGISGIASQSEDQPLKTANFPEALESFASAKS